MNEGKRVFIKKKRKGNNLLAGEKAGNGEL